MVVKLTIYDFYEGDSNIFDSKVFDVQDFEELDRGIRSYYSEQIRDGSISFKTEDGYTELFDTSSGASIDSYLFAYKSVADADANINGLRLAQSVIFDPEAGDYSVRISPYDLNLFELEDEEIEYWGIREFVDDTPDSLDSLSDSKELVEELTKVYFK